MPGKVRGAEQSFGTRLNRTIGAVDILALLAVPAVLVGVFALPLETRQSLTFSYSDPTVLTAFTATYTHLEAGHLLANVGGYLLVVPVAYLLSALSGHRQRFYTAFVTFLVVFSVILSYLNLAIARPGVGLGFSGVLLAFVGFLPVALASYSGTHFEVRRPLNLAGILFFLGLALIAVLAVQSLLTYALAVAALLSAVLYLPSRGVGGEFRARLRRAANRGGDFELAATAFCLFLVMPLVAFPVNLVSGDVFINVYIHLLGYALGFMTTYFTVQADRWLSAAGTAGGY